MGLEAEIEAVELDPAAVALVEAPGKGVTLDPAGENGLALTLFLLRLLLKLV